MKNAATAGSTPTANMPRQPITGSSSGRHEGRRQHARLPAETDIGRGAGTLGRRPRLGDQGHADAELAAKAEAGDGAIGQQVPIVGRQRAEAGEDGEQHDRPGQHPHPADLVGQHAEHDAADTAPTSVAVTRAAACAGLQAQAAEIARSMKPRISRSKPSIA